MLSLHEHLQIFNSHIKDKQIKKNHFQMGTMIDGWECWKVFSVFIFVFHFDF